MTALQIKCWTGHKGGRKVQHTIEVASQTKVNADFAQLLADLGPKVGQTSSGSPETAK